MSRSVPREGAAELDDLLSEEAIDHPIPFYGRVRDTCPVYWNKRWNGWVVSGYREVVDGFRNHEKLSSDRFAGPFEQDLGSSKSQYQQLFEFLPKFVVWKDQPYHRRIRQLVNKAFTPRSVEKPRPRVGELAESLIEPMRGQSEVDFLDRFAFTLPVVVIAEYLGVPGEARESVRQWSEDLGAVIFVCGDDQDRMRKGDEAMNNLVEFPRPVVAERRRAARGRGRLPDGGVAVRRLSPSPGPASGWPQ